MSDTIHITVPLVPPSVNHYVKHTRSGRHYVTSEAIGFMDAVILFARGRKVERGDYEVTFRVYLGKGQKGDLANFEKVIGDGLVKAGVIHSDAAITVYHQYKFRDPAKPRTEIEVRTIG